MTNGVAAIPVTPDQFGKWHESGGDGRYFERVAGMLDGVGSKRLEFLKEVQKSA